MVKIIEMPKKDRIIMDLDDLKVLTNDQLNVLSFEITQEISRRIQLNTIYFIKLKKNTNKEE